MSKLELQQLKDFFLTLLETIRDDDVGITWELEDGANQGLLMVLRELNNNEKG